MELQLAAELHLLRRQLDTHRDAHDRALHLCQTQRNLHTQLRIQAKTTMDNKDALERDIVALNARPFVDTNVEAHRIKRDVVASYNIEIQRATRLQEELQNRLVAGMAMQRELDDKIRSVQRETQELQTTIAQASNGIAVDAEEAALLAEISSLHNQWRSLQSSNEELLVKREAEKVRKQRVAKEMKMERRRNDAATVVQRYWRRYRARRRHICGQFRTMW